VGGRLFHWAENNSDCEIKRNGEGWLLQAVFRQWAGAAAGPSSRKIIFDVGANVGDFSAAVLATADRWQVIPARHARPNSKRGWGTTGVSSQCRLL
jgi:hypothetical protein